MREWVRTNILGGPENGYRAPDPDFGTAIVGKPAVSPPATTPADADEERLVAAAERLETVKDGLETALHGREPPHLDVGGTALGFVGGVVVRVLAHVVTRPDGRKRE